MRNQDSLEEVFGVGSAILTAVNCGKQRLQWFTFSAAKITVPGSLIVGAGADDPI